MVSAGLSVSSAWGADARVRAVHASPDAPNVDVLVNNNPAVQNLAFRQASGYLTVPAATYNFKVRPAGQPGPDVINADVPLASGTTYSVAAVDVLSSIRPRVFVDDNTLDPLNARVRFIHASPNAPAVDVALAGGAVLFGNVSFTESGGYISVPRGTYDLEVRLAGTSTVVLPLPGLFFDDNTVYTAWAMGLVGSQPTPLQAVLTVDAIPAPGAASALALAGVLAARRRR
jgi:hypothetical protein